MSATSHYPNTVAMAQIGPNNDVQHIVFPQFEAAAGGALFELRVRLLACKTKELQDLADAHKFDQVLRKTMDFFRDRITPEESEILELAKKVRNKIVHGDFKAAFWKLKPDPSGVKVIKGLENASSEEILVKIFAAAGDSEDAKPVPLTKDVGKFGWLMEAALGGLFQDSMKLNDAAIAVIERVTTDTALESIDDPEIREQMRRRLNLPE